MSINFENKEARTEYLNQKLDNLLSGINSTYGQALLDELIVRLTRTISDFNEEVEKIMGNLKDNSEKKSKIIHTSPQSATNHLIDVHDDLIEWWNSREVVQSRKLFEDFCNTISENPSKYWVDFLKGI